MNEMSYRISAREFIPVFHNAYHLHAPEACLEIARMYEKFNHIEDHTQCAMFWCRLARISCAVKDDQSFEKETSALMRALMNTLSDGEMGCVERSLEIFSEFDLQLLDVPWAADDGDDEVNLKEYFKELSERRIPARKKEKLKPAGFKLRRNRGGLVLSAGAWCACYNAAQEFGWNPLGTDAPCDYQWYWNGAYGPPVGQAVTSDDARGLSLALNRLIEAVRSGEKMTLEQLDAVKELEDLDKDLTEAQKLADYALDGWFTLKSDSWLS